jgi:predicted Zn-dependent protease
MKKYTRRDFLNYTAKISLAGSSAYAFASLLSSCSSQDLSTTMNQLMENPESLIKSGKALLKATEDFTPEQEYYIGRTVGAVVVNKYKPYDNKQANQYVNIVGQSLAQASEMPETFNGYHMLILDSQEINAFASPAGHIFVTRGMLNCCQNEGEIAAVLAHEIGHVQNRHGLDAIKKSRITEAVTIIGTEATKTFGNQEIAHLTSVFEDSIKDITITMINTGYSRSFEREADKAAVTILERIGYNPASLINMLKVMGSKLKPEGLDFAKTHPSPQSRIENLAEFVLPGPEPAFTPVQEKRFQIAMRNV